MNTFHSAIFNQSVSVTLDISWHKLSNIRVYKRPKLLDQKDRSMHKQCVPIVHWSTYEQLLIRVLSNSWILVRYAYNTFCKSPGKHCMSHEAGVERVTPYELYLPHSDVVPLNTCRLTGTGVCSIQSHSVDIFFHIYWNYFVPHTVFSSLKQILLS